MPKEGLAFQPKLAFPVIPQKDEHKEEKRRGPPILFPEPLRKHEVDLLAAYK